LPSITFLGDQNIVVDGLTRVNTIRFDTVGKSKQHHYQNNSISHIFWLGGDVIEELKSQALSMKRTKQVKKSKMRMVLLRDMKSLQDITTLSWKILA